MSLCFRHNKRRKIYLSKNLHPQSLSVVETRLSALDIEVVIGDIADVDLASREYSGILLQYPDTNGNVVDFESIAAEAKKNGVSFLFGLELVYRFLKVLEIYKSMSYLYSRL